MSLFLLFLGHFTNTAQKNTSYTELQRFNISISKIQLIRPESERRPSSWLRSHVTEPLSVTSLTLATWVTLASWTYKLLSQVWICINVHEPRINMNQQWINTSILYLKPSRLEKNNWWISILQLKRRQSQLTPEPEYFLAPHWASPVLDTFKFKHWLKW